MSISVIGLGYVGLSMAVFIARRGFKVFGVEKDKSKIEMISRGKPPFKEPGLQELLLEVLRDGSLQVGSELSSAVEESEILFITVGTPSRPDGSIDTSYVEGVARGLGKVLREAVGYRLVVVRSTVVPGTTRNVVGRIIAEVSGLRAGEDFGLAMNPEFLREGEALKDLEYPSRIIIGEFDSRSGEFLERFYRRIYGAGVKILRTSLENAEMIKYANNAFLATKISLINTIANICERVPGCDVVEVSKVLGLDPRISPRFLRAGLGYGGSCFPKDVKALIAFAKDKGYEPVLLEAVDKVNEMQPLRAVELCEELLGSVRGARVAVLGLSFKPNTDDMRGAVSVKVVRGLLDRGARVVVYDPWALENAKRIFGGAVEYAGSAEECLSGADCAIVVTEWDEFKNLQPEDFKVLMKRPFVVDGRRVFNVELFSRSGVVIRAIGWGG